MRIRRMTEQDVAYVALIEQQSFSQPWSKASFIDAQKDANALFLVAQSDEADVPGGIVGYIGMYLSVPEGEITNVAVANVMRGRGYGKALVRAMEQEALLCGVNQIFLEVRDSNAAAIAVYAALGFEELGIRKGFYDFPREDARIMCWRGKEASCGQN